MSKRKYTRVKTVESLIVTMRAEGLTLREIGDESGLSYKQMRDWSYRHNREQWNLAIGKEPRPKGRPWKDSQPPKQDTQKELERLRMENKLLRDFLQSMERK